MQQLSLRAKNKHSFISVNDQQFIGRSVTIIDGKVIVDGIAQDQFDKEPVINITVDGDVEHLETANGNVDCHNVTGDVNNTNGSITCKNVTGNVTTSNGSITSDDIGGNARSSLGNITADTIHGKVKTSMGNIKYKNK